MKSSYMTIQKLTKLMLIVFAISFVSLQSCKKNEMETPINNEDSTKVGFSVKNGFLVFESAASFVETTDAIANLSDAERLEWETKIGFCSQRRIVSTVIIDEIILDNQNEIKYAGVDISELNKADFHAGSYKNALAKGVIKIIDEGTDDEYWDYAIFNRGFVDFINEDGLFAVGDTLYQVTATALKAMKPADFSNTAKLINATEPDENNHIYFIHEQSYLKGTSPGLITNGWTASGDGIGDKRIKLEIYLGVRYYIVSNRQYQFYHDVYVQCQQKKLFGGWTYIFTNITVNGTWNVSIYYYPQYYGNSWAWNGSASYLKASINPETGQTAPYQSYFTVSPNYNNLNLPAYTADQFDYQPIFESYNWWALRDGGCCGLTSTLVK